MVISRYLLTVSLLALAACGCDRAAARGQKRAAPVEASTVAADPAPTDAQTAGATQPQTNPADTQPANAFLSIDGRLTEFPPARLRLRKTEDGVAVLLFSDDPRNATSAQYKGNSFYFDVALRVNDPADVPGAEYFYKAPTSEPVESPNGIFLDGTAIQLQPQDVVIRFDGEGKKLMAQVSGRFLFVPTTGEAQPGRFSAVTGTLFTTAEVKE